MHWPFELDTFQKDSVCRMEEGQSVFVAAHTSAGKTVFPSHSQMFFKEGRRGGVGSNGGWKGGGGTRRGRSLINAC